MFSCCILIIVSSFHKDNIEKERTGTISVFRLHSRYFFEDFSSSAVTEKNCINYNILIYSILIYKFWYYIFDIVKMT